jgi:hypothetical protein
MRRTAHQYIRDLEIRVASLEKQAYINNLGQIIKTSNQVDKVEKATIETAFVGLAEGLNNELEDVPHSFVIAMEKAGISSPRDIMKAYKNMDKMINANNPHVKKIKEDIDRRRSIKAKYDYIDECIKRHNSDDPIGFYAWLHKGNKQIEELLTVEKGTRLEGTDAFGYAQYAKGDEFNFLGNMLMYFVIYTCAAAIAVFASSGVVAKSLFGVITLGSVKVMAIVLCAYLALRVLGWATSKVANFFFKYLLPSIQRTGVKITELKDKLLGGFKSISRSVMDALSTGVSKLKSMFGFGRKSARYARTQYLPL